MNKRDKKVQDLESALSDEKLKRETIQELLIEKNTFTEKNFTDKLFLKRN